MYKLFIGNLSFKTTVEELRAIFEPHFVIEDLVIANDEKTGKSRGFGFVMTKEEDKGRDFLRRMPKIDIEGRLAYLKESTGKKKKGGGGPGGPGGPRRPFNRPMRGRSPRRGPGGPGGFNQGGGHAGQGGHHHQGQGGPSRGPLGPNVGGPRAPMPPRPQQGHPAPPPPKPMTPPPPPTPRPPLSSGYTSLEDEKRLGEQQPK